VDDVLKLKPTVKDGPAVHREFDGIMLPARRRVCVRNPAASRSAPRSGSPLTTVSYLHMHRARESDGNVSESPRIRASSQLNRA
jgi:hypothetical protein